MGGADGAFGGIEADEAVEDSAVGEHGVEPIDRSAEITTPLVPLIEVDIVVAEGDGEIRMGPPPAPPAKGER